MFPEDKKINEVILNQILKRKDLIQNIKINSKNTIKIAKNTINNIFKPYISDIKSNVIKNEENIKNIRNDNNNIKIKEQELLNNLKHIRISNNNEELEEFYKMALFISKIKEPHSKWIKISSSKTIDLDKNTKIPIINKVIKNIQDEIKNLANIQLIFKEVNQKREKITNEVENLKKELEIVFKSKKKEFQEQFKYEKDINKKKFFESYKINTEDQLYEVLKPKINNLQNQINTKKTKIIEFANQIKDKSKILDKNLTNLHDTEDASTAPFSEEQIIKNANKSINEKVFDSFQTNLKLKDPKSIDVLKKDLGNQIYEMKELSYECELISNIKNKIMLINHKNIKIMKNSIKIPCYNDYLRIKNSINTKYDNNVKNLEDKINNLNLDLIQLDLNKLELLKNKIELETKNKWYIYLISLIMKSISILIQNKTKEDTLKNPDIKEKYIKSNDNFKITEIISEFIILTEKYFCLTSKKKALYDYLLLLNEFNNNLIKKKNLSLFFKIEEIYKDKNECINLLKYEIKELRMDLNFLKKTALLGN